MAFSDRLAYLADTQCADVPLEGLESKAYAAARSELIDEDRGPVEEPVGNPWPFQPGEGEKATRPLETPRVDLGNTTHLSVIDRERNMVALTASLGRMFGSGVVVPGTGIVLNNGTMWFDPEPGRVNSIEPGKRTISASTPALVFGGGGSLMALGAPGGRKVITAVLQVILNVLDFGLGMQDAISVPRIHCETGPVHVDSRLSPDTTERLREIGHEVRIREESFLSSYFARPNGILLDHERGVLRGGAEPYKMATAIGI
jgi:gamma-glutamyltranspeptidase/glutathione hydrolase